MQNGLPSMETKISAILDFYANGGLHLKDLTDNIETAYALFYLWYKEKKFFQVAVGNDITTTSKTSPAKCLHDQRPNVIAKGTVQSHASSTMETSITCFLLTLNQDNRSTLFLPRPSSNTPNEVNIYILQKWT